ncbi:MAG: naringenin-chalcone synthase [Bdellovibrionales bacterium]|nr:naringenin-chalcone synthase [Bdellovibrionales bacterium]
MTWRISNFDAYDAPYVLSQVKAIEWLTKAYELTQKRDASQINKILSKFSAKPSQVEKRRHFIPDFSHLRWEDMLVFNLGDNPYGQGLEKRVQFFQKTAIEIMKQFYQNDTAGPDEIIHVTCTGYVSPSAPYHILEQNKWHKSTLVTQLYHMGCFAAIPALRLAHRQGAQDVPRKQIDIVHTELCSLYFNPMLFTPEQIVVQSLFADGAIKYSVSHNKTNDDIPGFTLENLKEEIVPDSLGDMTWLTTDHGFHMTLSREVPSKIKSRIRAFTLELLGDHDSGKVIFAIHPGGPKIIETIAHELELSPWQYVHSQQVLKNYGNMSSATLPYIWKTILDDSEVPFGTRVLSMAFGPGLTLCGALMRKT